MTSDRNTTVLLHRLAHARTGDKGNRSNISVIAYRAEDYALLVAEVTEARVMALFADRRPTAVKRYLLPKIAAMNFVLDDVLDGGVNDSLNLDTHGKSLSFHLLTLPIALPAVHPEAQRQAHPQAPQADDATHRAHEQATAPHQVLNQTQEQS